VLCHRVRSSPQMPGDHPVHPSFETSDKRLYVVSPACRRSLSGSVPPRTRVRAACPAPGDSPATSSGYPAGRTRFRRRCSSVALRVATAHSNPRFASGGQPAIMSHRTAASLKASWTASSAARRSPRVARRVVRTCLPGGFGDVGGDDAGGVPVQAAACP
jgi:hypothetical protein